MQKTEQTNLTPHLTTLQWRPWQWDDVAKIHELLVQIAATDQTDVPSPAEIEHIMGRLGEEMAMNTITAVSPTGNLAALAFIITTHTDDEHIANLTSIVHPAYRGKRINAALIQWMETCTRQQFRPLTDSKPQLMRVSCADHLTDRVNLYTQHGFEAARYAYKMQRSLISNPMSAISLPDGLHLATWQPEQDYLLMQTFNDAFSGYWGLPEMHEDLWQQLFTGVSQFRGDLTFLAMHGESIVGFCLNWVNDAKNRETDIKEGWIEAVGVIPAWRGHGIAAALLSHTLNAFIAAGLEQAALDVDTQNPTGALRLYEKMGFTAVKRTAYFVKPFV